MIFLREKVLQDN